MSIHLNLISISIALVLSFARSQTVTFEELIESRKKATADLAQKIGQALAFDSWCASSITCNERCVYHACSGAIGDDSSCNQQFYLESCADRDIDGFQQVNECSDTPYPNGSMLNTNRPDYRTYLGGIQSSGDGEPINVVDDLLRRDLCALKSIEDEFVTLFNDNNLSIWFYAGTANKASFSMPGATSCRNEDADNKIESCGYDPTIRPWYITAASGPRDIVFLLDRTSLTEKSVLKESFQNVLGTLDRRDRIAVVAFSNDETRLLPQGSDALNSLQEASSNTTGSIASDLETLRDDDNLPNMTLAFETAFNLLESADTTSLSSNCSKFIVAMIGQQDICQANCGSYETCTCVSDLSKYIETRQSALSNSASIVTFTESKESDVLRTNNLERLARTIVCSKSASGAWHSVQEGDSNSTAMSAFIQLGAQFLYQEELKVFSSEIYEDSSGLGKMFTLAVPVYATDVKKLLAVAALDMTVTEVMDLTGLDLIGSVEKIAFLSADSRDCPSSQGQTGCSLQALRNQSGSPICTDTLPLNRFQCFQFGEDVYLPVNTPLSFDEAQDYCANFSNGGNLAVVDASGKSTFISRMASKDGSWIGLRAEVNGNLKWINGAELDSEDAQFMFAYTNLVQTLHDANNEAICVSADARGVNKNWNLEKCGASRPFICQVHPDESSTVCESTYTGQSYNTVNPLDCGDKPLSSRLCSEEEDKALEFAQPFCVQNGSDFTEKERVCCVDAYSSDPLYQSASPSPSLVQQNSNRDISLGGIIGITVVVVFVVLCIGCAFSYFRRDNSGNRPATDTMPEKRPSPTAGSRKVVNPFM